MKHYAKQLREDNTRYRQMITMRGLADYICETFTDDEQDKLVVALQDPKLKAHVKLEIYFTEKKEESNEKETNHSHHDQENQSLPEDEDLSGNSDSTS